MSHSRSSFNSTSNNYEEVLYEKDNHVKTLHQLKSQEIDSHLRKRLLQKRKICGLIEGCDTIQNYEKLNKIHEGVYGVVYRAKDKLTGKICAIKKVKINREYEREGFPLTSIREFNLLLSLSHTNIVKVERIVVGNDLDEIFMVPSTWQSQLTR